MKESKAIHVAKRRIPNNFGGDYNVYLNTVTRDRNLAIQTFQYGKTQEMGTQFDFKRDTLICTCRKGGVKRKEQVYRSFRTTNQVCLSRERSSSYTDVSVVTGQPLQRKRIKKTYLLETAENGCGSSDPIGSHCIRRREIGCSAAKKTISKCVGSAKSKIECVVSKKLSPIIQTTTGTTSPLVLESKNIEIGSNTITKSLESTMTQVAENLTTKFLSKQTSANLIQAYKDKRKLSTEKRTTSKNQSIDPENGSSDSLLQRVYNLDNYKSLADEKNRYTKDPVENKLEREYRKIFTSKSKEYKKLSNDKLQDNSASTLKRRFEALRRGLTKTEESAKNSISISPISSQISASNQQDLSITSDPPSLEAHSFSQTQLYGADAFASHIEHDQPIIYNTSSIYNKSVSGNAVRETLSWDKQDGEKSDTQDVKGTPKSWCKKCNYEEDQAKYSGYEKNNRKEETTKISPKINTEDKEKKKFFFFRKKNKVKSFKAKKGVTAGCCEVKNGFTLKIGNGNKPKEKVKSEVFEEMIRAVWLQNFLCDTIESRRNLKVRWNNKKYNANSSTAFERIENIYKDTDILRSKSEISVDSSNNKSFSNLNQGNFADQHIEAWMVPITIADDPKSITAKVKEVLNKTKDDMEIRYSRQKWFIEKSKAFSHKIEVVLLSKNFARCNQKKSSKYLRIDIPKGFFADSNSASQESYNMKAELDTNKQCQSSDEMVYKVIEYETGSDLKKEINIVKLDVANNKQNSIKLKVSVKSNHDIKSMPLEPVDSTPKIPPEVNRELLIQSNNAGIPKKCGVIEIGTGCQKDIHMTKNPNMKIQDNSTDPKVKHDPKTLDKAGELSENYLGNYHRLWTPMDMELVPWCISDTRIHGSSVTSMSTPSLNYRRAVTKSCPHILDDFRAMISSCDNSILFKVTDLKSSRDLVCDIEKGPRWYQKLQRKCIPMKEQNDVIKDICCKRVFPKDSIEVFKRRKTVAQSHNRAIWMRLYSKCDMAPSSVPSNDSRSISAINAEPRHIRKNISSGKHVSLRDCNEYDNISDILNDTPEPDVIESNKTKHTTSCCGLIKRVNPSTQIPSQELCEKMESTLSSKASLTRNNLLLKIFPSYPGEPFLYPATPPVSEINCKAPGASNSKRSSPPPDKCLHRPPEPNAKVTKTGDESLPTDTKLTKFIACPSDQGPLPQSLFLSNNSKGAVIKNTLPEPPFHPKPSQRSQSVSVASAAISCNSLRSDDDDPYIYSSHCKCYPPRCCEKPYTRIQLQNQETAIDCHLSQHKHISVQASISSAISKLQPNTKNSSNRSKIQCKLSPDLILPTPARYAKPCSCQASQESSNKKMVNRPTPHPPPALLTPDAYNLQPHILDTSKISPSSMRAPDQCSDTFHLKKGTPIAEKNREDTNVVVQDESRNTSFERKKYTCPYHRPQVIQKSSSIGRKLYKQSHVQHSQVQRLQTCLPGKTDSDKDCVASKDRSDASPANTIEINFQIKVTQGNKPIHLVVDQDKAAIIKEKLVDKSQEVFVLKEEKANSRSTVTGKNDVNITIFIKKIESKSNKIGDDVAPEHAYSVQRAIVDLMSSGENIHCRMEKNKPDKILSHSDELFSTNESAGRYNIEEILLKVGNDDFPLTIRKNNENESKKKETSGPENSETNYAQPDEVKVIKMNSEIIETNKEISKMEIEKPETGTEKLQSAPKYKTIEVKIEEQKAGKKTMLELEIEQGHEPKPRKSIMEKVRNIVKVMLTSDSSDNDLYEDKMTDSTTEQAAYNSLKSSYLKATNVENNCYETRSDIVLSDDIMINKLVLYPTENNNNNVIYEGTKSSSITSDNDTPLQSCMCHKIAERLKTESRSGNVEENCCCYKHTPRYVKSQQTQCDLSNQSDSYDSDLTEYVDVETQNSRYLTSKVTSTNPSTRSHGSSIRRLPINTHEGLTGESQLECTSVRVISPLVKQFLSSRTNCVNQLKRNVALSVADEDSFFIRNEAAFVPIKATNNMKTMNDIILEEASILQSYETKKAVLEIYTENALCRERERLIARLPKFDYNSENEVYDAIATNMKKCRYPKRILL